MSEKVVKVLIVDDNEDDIFLIKSAFRKEGLLNPIAEAHNGQEAIDYLHGHGRPESGQLPAMILLDINMPIKNGFETLKEIKGAPELCHIPVVMLTTSKQEEDVVHAYSGGACTFISKPIGMENFRKLVRDLGYYWAVVAEIPGAR